jgi:hypothetical protein
MIPMDAQTLVVLLIVAAAVAYVARRAWRTIRASRAAGDASCGSGCGCEPRSAPTPLSRSAKPGRG